MSMRGDIESMWNVQRRLSIAQAIPLAGPFIFSPIKAVVSLAQVFYGIAASLFLGMAYCLTGSREACTLLENAALHMVLGFAGLTYSVINFYSFGVFGLFAELTVLYPLTHDVRTIR